MGVTFWRSRRTLVVVIITSIACSLLLSTLLYDEVEWIPAPPSSWLIGDPKQPNLPDPPPQNHPRDHPIDRLIDEARANSKQRLEKRSQTLEEAASHYRERRGRHPPPGFDIWFNYAKKKDSIIVEEFFDRIYHDINPFWALKPHDMRVQTNTQPQVIRVRQGRAFFETDDPTRAPWIQEWTALVKEFSKHLPDLDMVVNVLDETRVLVPWEKMAEYVKTERQSRYFTKPADAIDTYLSLADADNKKEPFEHNWIWDQSNKYWDHLRAACPPDSPSRSVTALPSFSESIEYPSEPMPYTYKGFVQNFTASQNPCFQPHLRGMHGTFVESVSMRTTHDLFPIFGGSKLSQNNDILVPGAMYLSNWAWYSGGKSHGVPWEKKKPNMVWRGLASGGRNKEGNWWHFHRHRFVQMVNGSTVSAAEQGNKALARTFALLPPQTYNISAQQNGQLGKWVSNFSDVGFVDLECFPKEKDEKGRPTRTCAYTDSYLEVVPSKTMKAQYQDKFLPDIDGNSFSARWRGFLRSTSMPLKATIYAEWHDDRLVPWVHFVPFDNSFMDIYAVMEYFLDHDYEAHRIAEEGRAWAESVLRRTDMMLYVWRLLLEYARVMDDNRDRLAFVADMK